MAVERYVQGIGISSDGAMANKATANRWILKQAQAALHAETSFNAIYADVQARLRLEMPYDGPLDSSDYHDYLSKLGSAVTHHPEIRAIADAFMSEAIPRFAEEWRRLKSNHTPLS